MEGSEAESELELKKEKTASSYRYWVRGVSEDAVPLPEPRKLSGAHNSQELLSLTSTPPKPKPLGSVWNQVSLIQLIPLLAFCFFFLPKRIQTFCLDLFCLKNKNKKKAGTWEEKSLNSWASLRIKVATDYSLLRRIIN